MTQANTLEEKTESEELVCCESRCMPMNECPYGYQIPKSKVEYACGPYAICLERHERHVGIGED